MTPAARVQAAIEILTSLQDTAQPIDRYLRDWFRARRYAGSKDRAAIAEYIYDVFRHRASYTWRMGSEHPRSLVIASLLSHASADDVAMMFGGSRYGPAPLDDAEAHTIANPPQGEPPLWVRGEFPAWLEAELERSLGDDLLAEMQAMESRASIDLRVNTLKASRTEILDRLRASGWEAAPTRFAPHGLRLQSAEGLSALQQTDLFYAGAFEFQDEGSQIVAHLVGAKPGERILDFAAGAGGKTLCITADMRNQGEIVAYDAAPERMKPLAPRARRAGAKIIRPMVDVNELPPHAFDAVLVDAPCSGSGTWRRNPDAKWRLSPSALQRLRHMQAEILNHAGLFVRLGGRLIYATCSVLRSENEDVVSEFLTRNAFSLIPVERVWSSLIVSEISPHAGQHFRASPRKTGTDGFFVSIMLRDAPKAVASEVGV